VSAVSIAGLDIGQLELLATGIGTGLLWTLVYRFTTRGRRYR